MKNQLCFSVSLFLCFSVSLFLCSVKMNAQECGFETPENYQTYESINTGRSLNSVNATESVNYCINVCFWIARNDDGTNVAFNSSNIPLLLNKMSLRFNPFGISFYQVGTFNYINNTNFNNGTGASNVTNNPNCLNIFIVNTVSPGTGYSGIANFNQHYLRVRGSELTQSYNETLNHEIGHCLNLLHTFNCTYTYNASCVQSPYNNNNCETLGDMICDTPADYYELNGVVQGTCPGNCPYPVSAYNPDITNIMSYWPSRNHFTNGQAVRMKDAILYAPVLQGIRAYQCAEIVGLERICPKENNTYSFPANGASLTYNWSVSGNLLIVGAATNPTVTIIYYQPWGSTPSIYSTLTLTLNGNLVKTKTIRQCYIRRAVGLYDWVSIDSGNMGLVVPVDAELPIASYKWEINEDENTTNNCTENKAHFVGAATNEPTKFSSTTNQAIVNWGSCSKSYLITCYGISETGAEFLINRSYVDVGDSKNNPCFKDAITTIVAPNPIHNGIIHVILNKPSHNTPCNYKDFNEPQYFNSELDQINNSVTIFDYNGNQVYRKVFQTNEFVIDDANLHSGNNYIVNLFTKEGGFTQQVIIVQ